MSTDAEKFDSNRRLCPDGTCVGLLDEAGRCKVCGRTASGDVAATPLYDDSDLAADEPDDAGDVVDAAGEEPGTGVFNPQRRLCPDGSCVGVLGDDGRCPVCGQQG
jgi:hypothetical protein